MDPAGDRSSRWSSSFAGSTAEIRVPHRPTAPNEVLPEDYYEFVPYNYGPFCTEVYADAETLAEEGLVQISYVAAHGYSQYAATPEGIEEGERLYTLLPPREAEHVKLIVDWVRAQSFSGLVSEQSIGDILGTRPTASLQTEP